MRSLCPYLGSLGMINSCRESSSVLHTFIAILHIRSPAGIVSNYLVTPKEATGLKTRHFMTHEYTHVYVHIYMCSISFLYLQIDVVYYTLKHVLKEVVLFSNKVIARSPAPHTPSSLSGVSRCDPSLFSPPKAKLIKVKKASPPA